MLRRRQASRADPARRFLEGESAGNVPPRLPAQRRAVAFLTV
jgi:hypothetical protein